MRRVFAFVVAILTFAALPSRAADPADVVLLDLFRRLEAAADPAEAQRVQDRIWERWMETGDPAADAALARGTVAMSVGEYALAMRLFDGVIARRPQASEGWNKRATLHFLLGDFDASVRDIERTLAIEPRHFGALSGLGMIETARRNHAAALDAYRRALAVNRHLEGIRAEIETLRNLLEGRKI
jgi:tetratricopeptide (TPR) repeat protein